MYFGVICNLFILSDAGVANKFSCSCTVCVNLCFIFTVATQRLCQYLLPYSLWCLALMIEIYFTFAQVIYLTFGVAIRCILYDLVNIFLRKCGTCYNEVEFPKY